MFFIHTPATKNIKMGRSNVRVQFHLTSVIILLMIVSFSLHLLDASDSSSDDEDFRPQTLDVDDVTIEIRNLKDERLPCRKLIEKVVFLELIPENLKELDSDLRQCENYYTRVIEGILDDLGLIGRAIRIWLGILNEFSLLDANRFRDIGVQNIQDIPVLHSMLRPVIEEYEEENREENHYLASAYLYGLGICTHLNVGPLFGVTSDLLAFWRHGEILNEENVAEHEFVFLRELEQYRDENGQSHIIFLMKTLANVCKSLARYPFANDLNEIHLVSGLSGVVDHTFHFNLNQEDYRDGLRFRDIHDILDPPEDETRLCSQADYFRFRKGIKFLDFMNDGSVQTDLIRAGARSFVEDCYRKIAIRLANDRIQLVPDDLETYVFTSIVRRELNDNHYGLRQMSIQLEMRAFMYSTLAERLFFEIPQVSELVDASRSLAAYLNGTSGPCKFYARFKDIHHHRTSLFELVEFFTFLISLDYFWHPLSNDATGFFFMWTMCRENRLIDMESGSS